MAWEALLAVSLISLLPAGLAAVTVSGRVSVTGGSKKAGHSPAVVWLTSLSDPPAPMPSPDAPPSTYRLVQKNKEFRPHLLIIPAGAMVEFPNQDPFFHNVFSLFDGKRFDLGLYEAGSTRSIKFSRPGISYIFCNIHPEMSAVIIALNTPYYGVSNSAGEISIANVPPGRYRLEVWREGTLSEQLAKFGREITVSQDVSSFGTLHFDDSGRSILAHKNKYGRDYDSTTSRNPLYDNPR
ncbi:MAG TPA: carboxypeptidase regulatory-like domain-containing protein [Terriglobia bacterium]|nr:carboxypeptidase regulatory-like domain-containing protein [Terriglobia bacterium]